MNISPLPTSNNLAAFPVSPMYNWIILWATISGVVIAILQMVGFWPYVRRRASRLWCVCRNKFELAVTPEHREARRFREILESDDPDIWQPLD
jgi:hypothetical protein